MTGEEDRQGSPSMAVSTMETPYVVKIDDHNTDRGCSSRGDGSSPLSASASTCTTVDTSFTSSSSSSGGGSDGGRGSGGDDDGGRSGSGHDDFYRVAVDLVQRKLQTSITQIRERYRSKQRRLKGTIEELQRRNALLESQLEKERRHLQRATTDRRRSLERTKRVQLTSDRLRTRCNALERDRSVLLGQIDALKQTTCRTKENYDDDNNNNNNHTNGESADGNVRENVLRPERDDTKQRLEVQQQVIELKDEEIRKLQHSAAASNLQWKDELDRERTLRQQLQQHNTQLRRQIKLLEQQQQQQQQHQLKHQQTDTIVQRMIKSIVKGQEDQEHQTLTLLKLCRELLVQQDMDDDDDDDDGEDVDVDSNVLVDAGDIVHQQNVQDRSSMTMQHRLHLIPEEDDNDDSTSEEHTTIESSTDHTVGTDSEHQEEPPEDDRKRQQQVQHHPQPLPLLEENERLRHALKSSQQQLWSLKDELERVVEDHTIAWHRELEDKERCKQAALHEINRLHLMLEQLQQLPGR